MQSMMMEARQIFFFFSFWFLSRIADIVDPFLDSCSSGLCFLHIFLSFFFGFGSCCHCLWMIVCVVFFAKVSEFYQSRSCNFFQRLTIVGCTWEKAIRQVICITESSTPCPLLGIQWTPTDHFWRMYHPSVFQVTQANSAWPSFRGSVQRVLTMVSATAGEETASSA